MASSTTKAVASEVKITLKVTSVLSGGLFPRVTTQHRVSGTNSSTAVTPGDAKRGTIFLLLTRVDEKLKLFLKASLSPSCVFSAMNNSLNVFFVGDSQKPTFIILEVPSQFKSSQVVQGDERSISASFVKALSDATKVLQVKRD